jgi:hypothetical protein
VSDTLFDLANPELAPEAVEELGIGQAEPVAAARSQSSVDPSRARIVREAVASAFKVHGAMTYGQLLRRVAASPDEVLAAFRWHVGISTLRTVRRDAAGQKVWALKKGSRA